MIELDDFEQYSAALSGQSVLPTGTVSALVAACRSKACAPPPVGTGGSTPTPSGTASGDTSLVDPPLGSDMASAADDTLDQFDEQWRSRLPYKVSDSKALAVACKRRSEQAIADEMMSTEEGRAAIGAAVASTIKDCPLLDRLTSWNNLRHFPGTGVDTWLEMSRKGQAPFHSLANDLIDRSKRRGPDGDEARAALADWGLTADDATPERLMSRMLARSLIENWAGGAISLGGSLQSQFAARDRYGLDKGVFWSGPSLDNLEDVDVNRPVGTDPLSKRLVAAALDAEYRATQKFLKETLGPDTKTVTLYRGVKGQYKQVAEGDVVEVESNPLSSWTTNFTVANASFSDGPVLKMEVPIEMIQSTPLTGRGCLDESEVLVIGYPSQARVLRLRP